MTLFPSPRRRPGSSRLFWIPAHHTTGRARLQCGVRAFAGMTAFFLLSALPSYAARSEIRNGQWYVDGEPFYVVAVGYNSLRPHQKPGVSYAQTNRRWTETDFRRIKAAHFNTLRTWDTLAPEELALAKKYGLMVLQGIWLDPNQDFSDPHNQESAVAQVETMAQQGKDYDNILGYLVYTEPSPEAVLEAGPDETLRFFRRLKRAIQNIDPRPVSLDSWLPLAFLDHSLWDFVTFNAFAFAPRSLNYALGYPGYVRWLVERFAPDRPLIVGETGGYAVSKSSFSRYGGYGGLSEYDQSIKDLESLRGTIEGHAAGAVLVSWIDAWHYPTMSETHADEPWAWDGLLAIPTDDKKDMDGIPRQVYRDVAIYNQALILEPKANHVYTTVERHPIQVATSDNIKSVDVSLNDGEWKPLEGSGHGGWHGFFALPKTARRRQRLTVRAQDDSGTEVARKIVSFVTNVPAEHVTLGLLDISKKTGAIQCRVQLSDDKQQPIANRKVYFGFFFPAGWRQSQGTLLTDARGEALLTTPLLARPDDHHLFVAAGTDNPDRVRTGDMRLFKLGS
jgi:hypothetical protein